MLPALSVHRLLTQNLLTLCKLPIKLIIKVVAVSQHNDGGAAFFVEAIALFTAKY